LCDIIVEIKPLEETVAMEPEFQPSDRKLLYELSRAEERCRLGDVFTVVTMTNVFWGITSAGFRYTLCFGEHIASIFRVLEFYSCFTMNHF
jgi:hypothetical protein